MTLELRWGMLGCGSIAGSFARDVQLAPGNRLVAVGSRDRAKAAAFAAAHCPAATAHGEYAALVADPAVQAVYIATPHSRHAADALLAINAGKHVLVEKPFALNAAEVRRVFAAARERGVFCGEAMWTRFLPVMAQVRAWIRSGAIGAVERIEADFSFRATVAETHRLIAPKLAGGALLDVGIYVLALVQDLVGRVPDTIRASARFLPNGVDGGTAMTCLWEPEGIRAQLSCALDTPGDQGARIVGASGTIEIPVFFSAGSATLRRADGTSETATGAAGFQFEILAATAAIRAGQGGFDLITPDQTIALATTLDAVRAQVGLRYPGE